MSAVVAGSPERSPSLLTSILRALLAMFLWAALPPYRARWVLLPALTGVMMMAMLVGAVLAAPREVIEGDVQRLMYLHVPSASAGTYLSFFITAAASVSFLVSRDIRWDAVARSAATVGVLFTIFTLATGAIWGKPIWGVYWTWDARLTSTLVLLLIYTAYLLARSVAGPNDEQAARYAAIFALIGFLDIPLIHFSVDWWRTLHPQRIIFDPRPAVPNEMLLVLLVAFMAITLLMLWLIALRSDAEQLVQRTDRMRARLPDGRERARILVCRVRRVLGGTLRLPALAADASPRSPERGRHARGATRPVRGRRTRGDGVGAERYHRGERGRIAIARRLAEAPARE